MILLLLVYALYGLIFSKASGKVKALQYKQRLGGAVVRVRIRRSVVQVRVEQAGIVVRIVADTERQVARTVPICGIIIFLQILNQ